MTAADEARRLIGAIERSHDRTAARIAELEAENAALRQRLAEGEQITREGIELHDQLVIERDELRGALRAVADIAGNLSDEAIQAVGGINDARALAIKVIHACKIACNALEASK